MSNRSQRLFLRVFVETKEGLEAENIASDLRKKFGKYGSAKIEGIESYWKIENYFELKFVIDEYEDEATYQRIMFEIGTGWETLHPKLKVAIWNVPEKNKSSTPMRWANLEEFD